MNHVLEEARDKFFSKCRLCSRAPGSYFWSGEHSVMYGQLAIVHAIPLYAYVGLEFTKGDRFEFEVRGVSKEANTARIEELSVEQIESIAQWHEEERINKYLDYWRAKHKQKCFKVKVWFEVPPKCGLNSSGAISAALSGLLQVLEGGENKCEETIKRINDWKNKSVDAIKEEPIFRNVFLKAWVLDDCSHGFSSSGNGPFCSIVGSPDGNLLLYLTQKKGFGSQHPIKRITKSNEELAINDYEEVEKKIAKINWWGKKLPLKENLKEEVGTALIYCDTPKDTGNILDGLNKRYNIPIEDFKSFFSSLFSLKTLNEFTEMAKPISDFIRDYPEPPLYTEYYVKSVICESLGLLSCMLVRELNIYQNEPEKLYAHVESINKLLDFYGVFGEQQAKLYKQIKSTNTKVGIKMTGAGGGGDLVVFGSRESLEGIEKKVKGVHAIHFDANHRGWNAQGLTITLLAGGKSFDSLEGRSSIRNKDIHYSLKSERGKHFGYEEEYLEKYAQGPLSKEPLVWMDLIAGNYSVWVKGKRRKIELSGKKRDLLHIFLRQFNKRIPMNELEKTAGSHPQVLNQLHNVTFNVLRPFMGKEPVEYRMLGLYSKRGYKRKFTFCLIEPYKVDDNKVVQVKN